MALRYGTSYFVSLAKAAQYYRDYEQADGYATAQRKIASGEINIGKPPLAADGSERWVLIDNGTRYAIEDSR